MSNDFRKQLVKDDLLMVSSEVAYSVFSGGQNKTTQVYTAISKSTSSISYNIQVGSETQILDRKLQMRNTYRLKLTGSVPDGQYLFDWGKNAALAPFPCNQSFQNVSVSINNSTVNSNVQDLLPMILKQLTKEELSYYSSTTPVCADMYASYDDAENTLNSPFGDFTQSDYVSPNGAWVLDNVEGNTKNETGAPRVTDVYVTFTTVEPIFISPFLYGLSASNSQGVYGLQSLAFNFNLASNANRVFRTTKTLTSCTIAEVVKSEMILNYITPHPSELLPATNVLPFYNMPIYKDVVQLEIPAGVVNATTGLISAGSAKIVSPSLSLNMIPDRMYVFVRKLNRTASDPDAFLPISDISLQVFNQAGILASATQQDIYRYARESGYTGTYLDFSGRAVKYSAPVAVGANVHAPRVIRTSGSILCLEFGRHIPLESWYAPGSLTNTSLQYTITVNNYTANAITTGTHELVLVVQNSGIMTVSKGTSSEYLGILSKSDVLDTLQQEPMSQSEIGRLLGSGFMDKLKSTVMKYAPKVLPIARNLLEKSDNPNAQKAGNILKAVGYGQTGAGDSGGARSRLAMRT